MRKKKKPTGTKLPASERKAPRRLKRAKARRFSAESVKDDTREAILEHAREGFAANPPVEVCGFIVTKGERLSALRSPNRAIPPTHDFRTCPKVWMRAEDDGWEIIAAYHSHNNKPPTPSDGDKAWSEASKVPFVIVGMPSEVFGSYEPTGFEFPLIGRAFVYGVLDCLTLIRDYYKRTLNIEIPAFDYLDDWWKPKDGKPPADLYLENYEKAGFVEVDTMQKHDVLLIQVPPSSVANHAAIFLGDGQILHHLAGRLSKREPFQDGTGWARALRKIVRHESFIVKES